MGHFCLDGLVGVGKEGRSPLGPRFARSALLRSFRTGGFSSDSRTTNTKKGPFGLGDLGFGMVIAGWKVGALCAPEGGIDSQFG
jgi:hypothetical protein